MTIQLILKNPNLSEDQLQVLTQSLSQTLNSETDIQAQAVSGESTQGSKGDPVTLGVLALLFLKSGAPAALIEVLKSFVMRSSTLEIEVKNGDKTVKITSENVKPMQLEQLLSSIKQLVDSENR